MQLPPISVLGAWPAPHYTNPTDTHGPILLILTGIFATLSIVVVTLRLYTRVWLTKSFGADDVFIFAAVFPTIGCAVMACIGVVSLGWDRHVYDVLPANLVTGLKFVMVLEILFAIACSLTKLSMLVLIIRLFGVNRRLRYVGYCLVAIVSAEMVIFTIVVINTCSPVSLYWTLSFKPQSCINETLHILIAGMLNTFTDFGVVLLPLPVVMKLKLPTRQHVVLLLLFACGFVVCFAGVARIYFCYQMNTGYDKTWEGHSVWIAGTVELYLGIIGACVPALKPFMSKHLPRILGTISRATQRDQTTANSQHIYSHKASVSTNMEETKMSSPRIPHEEPLQRPQTKESTTTTTTYIRIQQPRPAAVYGNIGNRETFLSMSSESSLSLQAQMAELETKSSTDEDVARAESRTKLLRPANFHRRQY